uniref:Uncharacterized protein n=1 Tax=Arundo donax TaxID=35708 RepID=A0A0A9A3H4_ARUDO
MSYPGFPTTVIKRNMGKTSTKKSTFFVYGCYSPY